MSVEWKVHDNNIHSILISNVTTQYLHNRQCNLQKHI